MAKWIIATEACEIGHTVLRKCSDCGAECPAELRNGIPCFTFPKVCECGATMENGREKKDEL